MSTEPASLIAQTQYELAALFEHGLAGSARFAPRFDELAACYANLGMNFAAEHITKLAKQLRSSGFEVSQESSELLALIHEYLKIVTDRLWYYEAKK
ncbi:MAG: hypothetical protein LBV04_00870 [Deferribacteraceae bacterium]|jgi:hypothetical protein|nr:hypothetical protein [Deferribacteraceae bacterium]